MTWIAATYMAHDATNMTDADLLAAFAAGDRDAALTLTQRLTPRVMGQAFRMLGNRAQAEDVAQDAMMRLWKIAPDWDADRAQVTTWLYRVAVNAAHDRRRRAGTRAKVAQGWGDWEVNRTEAMREQAEAQDWLIRAVGMLSNDLRDTVALVMDDMNHREVGEVLGVSEGTVSWRMSEVKKHLKALKESEQ